MLLRHANGHLQKMDLEGGVQTWDTVRCAHCPMTIKVPHAPDAAAEALSGMCKLCYQHVCEQCKSAPRCRPWEAWLDAVERQDRLRAAIGA
jgi:hypothetical protein